MTEINYEQELKRVKEAAADLALELRDRLIGSGLPSGGESKASVITGILPPQPQEPPYTNPLFWLVEIKDPTGRARTMGLMDILGMDEAHKLFCRHFEGIAHGYAIEQAEREARYNQRRAF